MQGLPPGRPLRPPQCLIHLQGHLVGTAVGRCGRVIDRVDQVVIFPTYVQRSTQVGEGLCRDVQRIGDGHGAHEASVVENHRFFQESVGRIHAPFNGGRCFEIMQGCLKQ